MANQKISQLPNAQTPLSGEEFLPVVQGIETKKAKVQDIISLVPSVLNESSFLLHKKTSNKIIIENKENLPADAEIAVLTYYHRKWGVLRFKGLKNLQDEQQIETFIDVILAESFNPFYLVSSLPNNDSFSFSDIFKIEFYKIRKNNLIDCSGGNALSPTIIYRSSHAILKDEERTPLVKLYRIGVAIYSGKNRISNILDLGRLSAKMMSPAIGQKPILYIKFT